MTLKLVGSIHDPLFSKDMTGKPAKFELKIAKVLCDAQGEFDWSHLKNVEGNPTTAYAYYDYVEMARKVIKKLGLKEGVKS